jgi:hypothetical protein
MASLGWKGLRVHSNGVTTEISDRWASWIVLRDWVEDLVHCMGP